MKVVTDLIFALVAAVSRHLHTWLSLKWRLDAKRHPASVLDGVTVLLRVHVPLVRCVPEVCIRTAILCYPRIVARQRSALGVAASSYVLPDLLGAIIE